MNNSSQHPLQQSHQPQLLRQLRQKSYTLNQIIQKQTSQNKQKMQIKNTLQSQLLKLKQQTQVQLKKHKSLIVLLNELQQTYHNQYLQVKQQKQTDQIGLSLENSMLRFLLIRKTQNIKQGQKLVNFLKHILLDKNKGKAKQFIKKSNFIQSQSQLMAKLKTQINSLTNQNLECKRKWYTLQQQSKSLQSQNKLLSIQNQRQKTQIKTLYEDYLQKINQAKMKIVSYNEIQKQSIINQYLVKQIAIVQQKRVQIQQQYNNLQYHHQNLREQIQRIEIQNKQLKGFFNQPGQQGTLANKMKKRIQELRDVLIQCKKKNKNSRASKLSKIIDNIKNKYRFLVQNNDYVELRIKQQQNYGSCLQQKPIADFFSKVLEEKDQALLLMRQQEYGLTEKVKQLKIQKQLLQNQIVNLQQNLNIDGWDTKYAENSNWKSMTNQFTFEKRQKTQNNDYETYSKYNYNQNNSSQPSQKYQINTDGFGYKSKNIKII